LPWTAKRPEFSCAIFRTCPIRGPPTLHDLIVLAICAADGWHVTRARVTQIMNLLNLALDIQEAILFLKRVEVGRAPISEWQVRPIAGKVDWGRQRKSGERSLLPQIRQRALHLSRIPFACNPHFEYDFASLGLASRPPRAHSYRGNRESK
jgi:hypothetical protein